MAPTRSSSPNRASAGIAPKPLPPESTKGKFGLIFLGLLAVVVIAALVLTRK